MYTPEEFKQLAHSRSAKKRCLAASDYFCPAALLVRLSTDKDNNVRCYVAANRTTPPQTLLSMSTDSCIGVRYKLLWNPNTAGRKVSGPTVDSIPRQHLGPWVINGKDHKFTIEAHKLPWAYGVIGKTPVTL